MKLSVLDQSPVPSGSTPADALNNTIHLARAADSLGYERYWIAEHHAIETLASPAPLVRPDDQVTGSRRTGHRQVEILAGRGNGVRAVDLD